jgi:hypothetical protein
MRQIAANLCAIIFLAISLSSCDNKYIYDSDQLLTILNSLQYSYIGPYSSEQLSITENIQIVGRVTIAPEEIEAPNECIDQDDCRHQVSFAVRYDAEGISLSPVSSTLTLTNVRLRFRPLLVDVHPSGYNFIPVIYLMPPSDYECKGLRCDIDQVCYSSFAEYCQHCLTLSHPECVCRHGEETISPDGTYCEIFLSGDMIASGECQNGVCIAEW